MAENQESMKPKEKEIPVLSVLKSNCILKNIFLLDNPPSISSSSSSMVEDSVQESEIEETLLVGRHPDCHIKLEHPSISRFHLRIHSLPSSRSLYVTDLSSVHGTWISGKKVEPEIRMKLNEGDTLQLGGSSRLYRLHWVPLSRAYDTENPFVPRLDAVEEETEGELHQDDNSMPIKDDEVEILIDKLEGLELLPMQKLSPFAPIVPGDLYNSFSSEEVEENKSHGVDNQEACQFDKENYNPRALFPSMESQTATQLENLETSGIKSEKRSNKSIWSRRGKPESGVQIKTGARVSSQINSPVHLNYEAESAQENHYVSPDQNEQIFTPDKENRVPSSLLFSSLKKKGEEVSKSASIFNSPISSDEEIFTPDKENMTPNTRILSSIKKIGNLEEVVTGARVSSQINSPVDENYETKSVLENHCVGSNQKEQVFTPDKENRTPSSLLFSSLKKKDNDILDSGSTFDSFIYSDEEIFTPDKESMTPNTRMLRSLKKIGNLEEVEKSKSYSSSPLKRAVNCYMNQEDTILVPSSDIENPLGNILQERKPTNSENKTHASMKKKPTVLKARADREPFRPLPVNSISNNKSNSKLLDGQVPMRSGKSINYPESEDGYHPHYKTKREETKAWIIIVDTAGLLNKKSRKELQLLRGLKGTNLIIPRIVVRELDCMLKRGSFFRRTTEVSAALQWIEDCMANAKWWIHVQTSAEESGLIPPTPPASSPHWFGEEKGAFHFSANPFSPYSLQEIVTPTAEDHILECALFFKRTRNEGQLVLLSDDVTLKIKAMAEGVICETAEEFRGSLVNPFSERFLYADSSPRGPTWSCADDAVLKEKYYPSPSKKLSKSGDGVKGLKLILLHNSNFRQIAPFG
ncbi:hypothetical protein ACJIZ3_019072 [Penstemon smallii]|uniref:FHA domain-containing protein n=1 Tax=Penstemon smallii TaxID=265156 RepID=A0ABD3T067_9LAMI